MNRTFKIILTAAVIILESCVLSNFRIWGVKPDYALALLLAITVIAPEPESVVLAFAAGIFADLLSGAVFGLNTLLFMYLSLACALFVNTLYIKKMKLICPMCFVAAFLYEAIFAVLSMIIREAELLPIMFARALSCAVLDTVIFVILYLILLRVHFEKKPKGIKYESGK
ncbi:MAG: rod shape-determining protein MreD [Clostridia bacterium]|nr:rod shape-determining protein MreD [Clostridia bacterium]